MKKPITVTLILALMLTLSLSLSACSNTTLPDRFDRLYTETGKYIQLGMTENEVSNAFGSFEPAVIYSDYGMLRLFFESNRLYSIDTMYFGCEWIFPGGIQTGSNPEKIEQIFDMNYADISEHNTFRLIRFSFNEDHDLVDPFSFESVSSAEFTIDLDDNKVDTISIRSQTIRY